MNKFMFACIAFVAIAANCVMAKPCLECDSPAVLPVDPSAYAATAAPSVSFQAIPVSSVSSVYSQPSSSYNAPSPSYNVPVALLQPIAIQASHDGYASSSLPSVLIAAASQPVAQSSASTSVAGLLPGHYSQLVIPSYEILAGDKLNLVGGHANIGVSAAQIAY